MPGSPDDFDSRLRDARQRHGLNIDTEVDEKDSTRSMMGLAFRIGVELVAALVVGLGLGLLIDRSLGTAPWGLIVLVFLGAAAGMLNVYRAINGMGYTVGYDRGSVKAASRDGAEKSED